jgi:predicted site-specific integrase-resolvase
MKWMSIGKVAEEYGVSTQTIRNWEKEGMFSEVIRTRGGHRRFAEEEISEERKTVVYARVSSNDQKKDLERQIEGLENYCKGNDINEIEIIKDIGSGINYNKRGIKKLIRMIVEGKIARIVISFKDRLLRFGLEMLEQLCELKDVEIVVVNGKSENEKKENEQFVEDVLAILIVYSSKIYGKRSHAKRKNKKAKIKKQKE